MSTVRGVRADLVCVDVDGTLVGSEGTVRPDVWAAAERVRARGVRLALCSGRPGFALALEFARRLDATGWHIFQNGASILNLATGESRSRTLSPATVRWLVARGRETGRVLEVYTDRDYAGVGTGERSRQHAALLGVPFHPRDPLTLDSPVVRAQWLVAPHEVEPILAEPHGDLTLSASSSPVMPDTVFINMTPPGADKASAVRAVAAAYGVPLERVMFVGDGGNDIGAMRAVGVSVAMANAEPSVLAVAGLVVGDVDDGGLIEAFELALGTRE